MGISFYFWPVATVWQCEPIVGSAQPKKNSLLLQVADNGRFLIPQLLFPHGIDNRSIIFESLNACVFGTSAVW